MSIKDKTEQVLRDIYVLLSQSEVYDSEQNKIILDKKQMVDLLNHLNVCIYGMMDEYGISQRGRDKLERETKKAREDILRDANKGVEDIYAAAFLYTDEALRRVLDIMQEAAQSFKSLSDKVEKGFQKEKESVQKNKRELRSQLQVFKDTDKYLKLIDEQNKAIEKEMRKEKRKESNEEEDSPYANIKPEIKINAAYFEKAGIPIEEAGAGSAEKTGGLPSADSSAEEVSPQEVSGGEENWEAPKETVIPEIRVNLDAEYFKWKESGLKIEENEEEEESEEKKQGIRSVFGKTRKK